MSGVLELKEYCMPTLHVRNVPEDLYGQIQKLAEIDFVKALEGRELPDERPELVAEFREPWL